MPPPVEEPPPQAKPGWRVVHKKAERKARTQPKAIAAPPPPPPAPEAPKPEPPAWAQWRRKSNKHPALYDYYNIYSQRTPFLPLRQLLPQGPPDLLLEQAFSVCRLFINLYFDFDADVVASLGPSTPPPK